MKMSEKTLTYAKIIQMFSVTLAIMTGFVVNLFDFDSSPLFYLYFFICAFYVLAVLIDQGIGKFLRRNRTLVLVMVMLAVTIAVNPQFFTIYSIVRLMEVFMYMFASMVYTGCEDLDLVKKGITGIFRLITAVTFFMTAGSFILSIFGSSFAAAGMKSFFSIDMEKILKWNADMKQMTLGGLYMNGNQLGLNAYCSGMLSIYLLKEDGRQKLFQRLNLFVQIIGVIFCGCRSIMIALGVTAVLFAMQSGRKNIRKLTGVMLVVLAAGIAVMTVHKMQYIRHGGEGLSYLLDRLTGNRFDIWKEAFFLFRTHPVFGVGLGNINKAARKLITKSLIKYHRYNNAHNIFLNILACTGIFGSACFLMLGRDMKHGLKRVSRILGIFCAGILAADCFDIFLIFTDKFPTLLVPVIAGFGIALQAKEEKPFYFFSNLVEEDIYRTLYTKKERPGQQAQKFNRLIAEGFELNGRKVTACTAVLASDAIVDYKFRRFRNHGMYRYSLSFNIPLIKNIWNILSAFFYILFAEYGACVIDVLSIDNAIGALLAAKLRGMPTAGIVTDLPEHFSGDGLYAKIVYRIMDWCGSYVFLTPFMNEKLNPKGKPWIVMEGLCDVKVTPAKCRQRDHSIIFAGEIDEQNGVINLVQAYKLWGNTDYDLYFYGSGEAMEKLEKEADGNEHIHIMGVVLNRELLKIMDKASLLVNPRPIHQDFVRYSFPSKVMEYMNTGTYHASSRLICIPDEYFLYIGDMGEGSVEDILAFFREFEKMPEEEKEEKGRQAQQFVLTNKNNKTQAARIASLLDGMYEQ